MQIKPIIKDSFEQLIADRFLTVLIGSSIILAFIAAIIIGLSIHPSGLQLVSHYSAFGITHLYRDQWFYLLVFVLFELVAVTLHTFISIKLLIVKGHSLAVMFAWMGIGVILLGLVTAMAVLNVWTPA